MASQLRIKYNAPSEGFFDVPGVVDGEKTRTYRIFERMTPAMTQDQLSDFYEKEKPRGNPHPMNSILHFAISLAGYNLRNECPSETEQLRSFLRKGFRKFPNTLTRIIYNPSGRDKVVHNYGTSDKYTLNNHIFGSPGLVLDISDKNILKPIFGTEDVDKVNSVFHWLHDANTEIWRIRLKPENVVEKVVGLDACIGGLFTLDCCGDPLNKSPAFRVLRIE